MRPTPRTRAWLLRLSRCLRRERRGTLWGRKGTERDALAPADLVGFSEVPRLCDFYGIVILMFTDEGNQFVPHATPAAQAGAEVGRTAP